MAPAVPRKIEITYGSIIIGGLTDRQPYEKIVSSIDYDLLVLEVPFVITDGMQADIAVLEAGLRKPRQSLTIKFDSSIRSFSASAGTGYDIRATLFKPGNDRDTNKTRLYVFRAEVKLPADLTGQDGRKEAEEDLTINENRRRTLILTGLWTQVPGKSSAQDAYDSGRVGYAAAAIGRVPSPTGTWELVTNRRILNDEDTELRFELTFEEVKAIQDTGILDSPTIVQPSLLIARVQVAGDDAPVGATIRRPVTATVSYSVSLDFTLTTDPFTFWTSTSQPFVVKQAQAILGAADVALMDDSPQLDHDQNRIIGNLTLMAYFPSGDANAVQFEVEVTLENQTGDVVIEVWDKANRYAAEVEEGPAKMFLNTTETLTRLGDLAAFSDLYLMVFSRGGFENAQMAGFGALRRPADLIEGTTSRWVHKFESEKIKPRTVGIEPFTVSLLDYVRETRFRRADSPTATIPRGSVEPF